jgi:hypothetical protein
MLYEASMETREQFDGTSVLLERLPEVRGAPVGLCIYRGADRYSADGGRLREEHIVPFSINGRYTLPEASCQACEQITGRTEALVMRGGFRAVREYLQFQSRTKKRPTHLPLFGINGDPNAKVMVPVADYPVTWMIPRFSLPGILMPPGTVQSGHPKPWTQAINYDAEKLGALGIRRFNSNAMDMFAFVRMLAKIGHAHAIMRFGPNHFVPFLRHIILHDAGPEAYQYVGGVPERPHDSEELHGLTIKTLAVGARRLIAAEIRLFATFGAPIHLVMVGEVVP